MPELEGEGVTSLVNALSCKSSGQGRSYSLSAAQVHDDLYKLRIFFKKELDDLFDRMHPKPIATVDQRVPSDIFLNERFIEVWFAWEVQLGHAPFGNDAAVVRLDLVSGLVRPPG